MSRPEIKVTDHAVLRYLETVRGVKIHSIRRKIEKATRLAIQHGASGATVDGVRYKIQDEAVTTVMSPRRRKVRVSGDIDD